MRLRVSAIILIGFFLSARPAHADLIDFGGGLIYDSTQNLTWLQDTMYSRTSGVDADGLMTLSDATTWVSNLVFEGMDDWRLPTLTAPIGPEPMQSSEISRLMFQLGWHWELNGFWEYRQGLPGPFINLDGGPGTYGYNQTWIDGGRVWNAWRDIDIPDGVNPGGIRVWAVRNGAPIGVPEPATAAVLLLGMAAGVIHHRRMARRAAARPEAGG